MPGANSVPILEQQLGARLRHRHPDADVRVQYVAWNDVQAALLEHRTDVVVGRLPFPTEGLHVTVLYDDVDPSHVILATRADERGRLVAAFGKYARTWIPARWTVRLMTRDAAEQGHGHGSRYPVPVRQSHASSHHEW